MTHLVLARKYRPKTFARVVGQDIIISTLKAAIVKDRVAHALLFTGSRGCGKTSVARLVAKALVCLKPNDAEPCGVCAQCLGIDNFSSLDVLEIDGASHTSVDDVRDLRESARFQPTSAKRKIFIIDEVHMLSISAFNALLKILEEPPPHVMFIFATTEVHKIPKTIISRCQRYDFRRVSPHIIFDALKSIGKTENFSIADDGLRLIASISEGGLRDALSMTDQIISSGDREFSAEDVAEILGVVSHQAVKEICQHVLLGQSAKALLIIKEVYEKGFDLCHLMDAMAEHFRIKSLCAHVDEKAAFLLMPSLDLEDFRQANREDKADLKRLFAMSMDGLGEVFNSEKPLLALELFVLRAALRPPIADAITINYCLNKLDAILQNRPLPKDLLTTTKTLESTATDKLKDPVTSFREVLTKLANYSPSLASHLRHARPIIYLEKRLLELHFEQTLHYEEALAHREDDLLTKAVQEVFGHGLTLSFELKKQPMDPATKSVQTVAEADAEKAKADKKALFEEALEDPMVKKALEIFGGEITEVNKL